MAVSSLGHTLWAAPAGADLTGKNFYLAKLDASGNVVLGGAGDIVAGVIYEEAVQGKPATVQLDGIGKVILAEDAPPNTLIACDANGKGIPADHSEFAIGLTLVGGVAGDIVSMKIDMVRSAA